MARSMLRDNGKEFTDRLFGMRKRSATGKHEFDKLCAELDIEHRLTLPKSPQTNGMVERFNGRIEDVLQGHHFKSGEDLAQTLERYVWLYNQQLPQSVLGSKTPLQAMKDWYKLKPELFKKNPYQLPGRDTYGFGLAKNHPFNDANRHDHRVEHGLSVNMAHTDLHIFIQIRNLDDIHILKQYFVNLHYIANPCTSACFRNFNIIITKT